MHLKGENIKMAHRAHFKMADECNFTELSGVSSYCQVYLRDHMMLSLLFGE